MKGMNRFFTSTLYAVLLLAAAGCARVVEDGPNDANKRYFDAWMELNHPGVTSSGLGIYIIEEEKGSGTEVLKDGYALIDYRISDLEGNITDYTDKETAKQLGTYDTTTYYGPKFQITADGQLPAGLSQALVGMKAGGHRKVIIPSWLMTYSVYDTEKEYLAKSSSSANTVYDITVADFTTDISEWQTDRIEDYFKANSSIFEGMTVSKDSIPGYPGFYYKELKAPSDTASFKQDTVVYINYTGRLLNGLVFDTTDERIAKDNGIYSSSRTYEPVQINWGEEYSDITMGSSKSSVVSGFALTLWQMKAMEKGIGVFISDYGYQASGNGASIPGFSPLVFEIELVAKPED